MFLAVWMLYVADRLLDARTRQAGGSRDLEERHRFHARHQQKFIAGLVLGACLLAVLLPGFTHAELRLFAALGALLFAYFFLIHLWPSSQQTASHRLPKELAVGVFFAAAVFIPTISRAPGLRPALFPVALLFATTCTLNCLYIFSWEHPGRAATAHWTTKFAVQHIRAFTWFPVAIVTAISFTLARRTTAFNIDSMLLLAACAMSLTLFRWLNARQHRFSRTGLRAAADLALLTPLLYAPLFFAPLFFAPLLHFFAR